MKKLFRVPVGYIVALALALGLWTAADQALALGITRSHNIYTHVQSLVWNHLLPLGKPLLVAAVAQSRAGDPVVVDLRDDYSYEYIFEVWGIVTNSEWLAEQTRLIAPYFEYEELTPRMNVPKAVVFFPGNSARRSLHVLGWTVPAKQIVWMNERLILDARWNDERQLLQTLTHELIHDQLGNFATGNPEDYESATDAATTEVLAGMCNHAYELACGAFWSQIEDHALAHFKVGMHERNLDPLADLILDAFFVDDLDAKAKSMRFWEPQMSDYWYIIRAYGERPYLRMSDGLNGLHLDTGIPRADFTAERPRTQKMPFDDTEYLLGWLVVLVK